MDYVAIGNTMLDTIVSVDGSKTDCHLGGPAPFAYSGIRVWDDSCRMVTNVGDDYDSIYGDWVDGNGVCREGITVFAEFTHNNALQYHEDGTYHEINGRGRGKASEMGYMEVRPWQFEQYTRGAKAVYFFYDLYNPVFWEEIFQIKRQNGFEMMWEISAATCDPEYLDRAKWVIENLNLEMFSINYPESKRLFGVDTREDAIAAIRALGVPFSIMRDGKNGMYVITPEEDHLIASIDFNAPVDPTGCGNCSTGAAMYAWHQTHDPIMAGVMANISSGFNVMQYGLIPEFTPEMREKAHETAEKLYAQYTSK